MCRSSSAGERVRQSARVLLLDSRDRVLLFKFEDAAPVDPLKPDLLVYWVTPGGGLEPGETFEQAARRELWEEAGIGDAWIGPWLWTRQRRVILGGEPVLAHERCFLARVTSAEVSLANLLQEERRTYRAHRWWSLEEMRAAQEVFLPPGLIGLLEPVIAGHLPDSPPLIET